MIAAAAALMLTLAPVVIHRNPAPGAHLRTFYPSFSATIQPRGAAVRRESLHLFVDGKDVTPRSSLSGDTIAYVPRERMDGGWHDVFIEGADVRNHAFNASWAFESQAPDVQTTRETSSFTFFPSGGVGFFPGDFLHFVIVAPVGGIAFLQGCGFGGIPFQQFPGSPLFFATVPGVVDGINPFLNCQVSALFTPFGGFSALLLPLPVPIAIAGPEITSPTTSTRRIVPVYRGTEPTVPAVTSQRVTLPSHTVPVFYGVPPQQPMPVRRTMPVRQTMPMGQTLPVRQTMPVQGLPYAPAVRAVPGPYTLPVVRAAPPAAAITHGAPVVHAAPVVHPVPAVHPAVPIPHPH